MNRNEIISMARYAGFVLADNCTDEALDRFKKFAAFAADIEREACALVCESNALYGKEIQGLGKVRMPAINMLFKTAAAIRARGKP